MGNYSICGIMIHARPDKRDCIENILSQAEGVEVHANTDEGKLVVTVESEDDLYVADTIFGFKDMDGVLTASMIYQYRDDVDNHD